ncbi:hypothetical protein D521_0631 [beta proteobacterium CB]|jgi:hypothetical protein|nr:hypothetical protein D521_0631 [beta proteobacterium CB]
MDNYSQELLDRVVSMTREIDNLRSAYVIVSDRLNSLSLLTAKSASEILEEAAKVEEFAKLAVEATKLTEQSALLTNNQELIDAAKKSSTAALSVHELAMDLRLNKLQNLKEIK